ncbi:MAG: hypothetical protein Q9163_000053 [Psora crenata]
MCTMRKESTLRLLHRTVLRIHRPVLDFLLPNITQIRLPTHRRNATISNQPASPSTEPFPQPPKAEKTTKRLSPLSHEQRAFLSSALRVNQAGELAATLIYTHQTPPILRSHPHLRSLMQHMHAQEARHFATFNHMLAHHRVRPTVMYPVWTAAASLLGWGTGLLGREAAMACTEAVETEIGNHYNGQVRVLLGWIKEMEEKGEEVAEEIKRLVEILKRIRDEELEHLDEAVGEGAKEAKPYQLLNRVIRSGCKGAIWLSERV